MASVRAVMAGGHLDEGGPVLVSESLRLRHEQASDPAFAGSGIHDKGEDAYEVVIVLEAGQGMECDEPDDLAAPVRDHDLRLPGKARQARDDGGRSDGIALVREECSDPFGVAGLGRPEDGPRGLDHATVRIPPISMRGDMLEPVAARVRFAPHAFESSRMLTRRALAKVPAGRSAEPGQIRAESLPYDHEVSS